MLNPVAESTRRPCELVCRCGAYSFPHRFTGGRCSGTKFAQFIWYGGGCGGANECQACTSNNAGECDVIDGREDARHCEAITQLREYFK